MSDVTPETVLAVLARNQQPMTIREIAQALSYHTNTPWAVVFAVKALERAGQVAWERRGRPWRVRLAGKGA